MPKTYTPLEFQWRNKWLTADATNIDEMISRLRDAADELERMQNDGIVLDFDASDMESDYATLKAPNRTVAKKHGFTVAEL